MRSRLVVSATQVSVARSSTSVILGIGPLRQIIFPNVVFIFRPDCGVSDNVGTKCM
jgi:hypothetical protein